MRSGVRLVCLLAVACVSSECGWSQSNPSPTSVDPQKPAVVDTQKATHQEIKKTGPGKEMGKGGEDIGVGAAKGTGDLAKGTAGAAGNLAHGNVGGAGASFGKGVGGMGKNVAVGTAKGAGKIGKGLGGELKKF
jgi:hypothetical protein